MPVRDQYCIICIIQYIIYKIIIVQLDIHPTDDGLEEIVMVTPDQLELYPSLFDHLDKFHHLVPFLAKVLSELVFDVPVYDQCLG